MKSHEIMRDLRELQEIWRKQDFVFTEGQQKTYDNLLKLRRERVGQFK
jgi:hypothetical protein